MGLEDCVVTVNVFDSIFLRILYGRMRSKTGSKTQGRSAAGTRMSIVLRFLAGSLHDEIRMFLDLLYEPVKHLKDGMSVCINTLLVHILTHIWKRKPLSCSVEGKLQSLFQFFLFKILLFKSTHTIDFKHISKDNFSAYAFLFAISQKKSASKMTFQMFIGVGVLKLNSGNIFFF